MALAPKDGGRRPLGESCRAPKVSMGLRSIWRALPAKQRLSSCNVENDEKVVAKLMSYVLSLLIDATSHRHWENCPSGIKIIFIDLAAPAVLCTI